MPVNTYQVANVVLSDTFTIFASKTNSLISIVNGLPSTSVGGIGRTGGTIDGGTSGPIPVGETGHLFIIELGGLAIGDYLGAGELDAPTGDISILQKDATASINVVSTSSYANVSITSSLSTGSVLRLGSTHSASDWTPATDAVGTIEFYGEDTSGSAPGGPGVRNFIKSVPHGTTGYHWDLAFGTSYQNNTVLERLRIKHTGYVGIGTADPLAPLHVIPEQDLSLSTHGTLMLGEVGTDNMVLDANEIQSRNNGVAVSMYLQTKGGHLSLIRDDDATWVGGVPGAVDGSYLKVGGGQAGSFGTLGTQAIAIFNNVTGRVGINDNSPSYTLDVDGDFRVQGLTNSNLFFVDRADDRVGIGTNSPGYALHVSGGGTVGETGPSIMVSSSVDSTKVAYRLKNGDGGNNWAMSMRDAEASDDGDGSLDFWYGGQRRLVINHGGNVGINDGSPTYKLDVNGTLRAVDAVTFGSTLDVTGDTTLDSLILSGTTYSTKNAVHWSRTESEGTEMPANEYVNWTTNGSGGAGTAPADGAQYWRGGIDNGSYFIDYDRVNTNFSAMQRPLVIKPWTSSGSVRVGINKSSPGHLLHANTNVSGDGIYLEGSSAPRFTVVDTTGTDTIGVFRSTDGSVDIGSFSNFPVSIFTDSAERIHIKTGGNVGIGTADPKVLLHLVGGNGVSDPPSATSGHLVLGDTAGQHVIFDTNEIQSASNATTPTTLFLNHKGGVVKVGGGSTGPWGFTVSAGNFAVSSGTITSSGDITTTSGDVDVDGAIVLDENSSAPATPVATGGQIWVKNTNPTELWFTDGAGTDFGPLTGQIPTGSATYHEEVFSVLSTASAPYGANAAHTLGSQPKLQAAVLRCASPELGYVLNDEIPLGWSGAGGSTTLDRGVGLFANATYLGYTIHGNALHIMEKNDPGGTAGPEHKALNNALWQVVFRVWK